MAGLFDDLKPGAKPSTGGGLFDDLIPAAPPKRGAIRGVADVGLEVGSGAVRGVKFVADAFGADNPVSSALGTADKFLRDYLSAQAKADDQAISRIMAEAQDKGVWEQVQAGLKAFGVAPVRTAANALGTSLPMIAAAAVPPVATAGAAARVGALATLGGVQGAGIGKSSIYEAVKEEGVKAGMAPDAAERLAVAAQEYNGQNLDSIIAAAGLGAAGMATGVQPILARAFSGAAARSTAVAAGEKVPGMLRSAGVGVLKEAPLEAAQGGQEQLAGNIASQRAGFDVPTMRGVVSSATMEGVAAGPMGAIGGVMDRGHRLRAQESAAAAEQLRAADAAFDAIGSAGTVDEAIAAATAATRVPVGETIELVPEEVDPAGGPGSISMRQRIQERRARRDVPPVGEVTELGLAEAAALSGPLSRETQVRPVPTGQAIELGLEEVEPAPPLTTPEPPARAPRTSQPSEQEAFRQRQQQEADAVVAGVIDGLRKVNTMQARAYVQDFDAGRVTRQDVLDLVKWKPAAPPQPVDAQARLEQAAAAGALAQQKRDETALLLTADGMPYGTRASAVARASREGGGDVIEVAGGWAVRPQGASDAQQVSGAGVPAPAADGGVRLGADAAGGERAPAGVPVPDPGARQPAFSGQPDVAVADAGGPDAALSGFTDGMSQTRAGAVRMTLRAPAGQPFGRRSRQEVVQEMVADGATVVLGSKGQRILRAGNVAVDEGMLNRTALDYAEHLIARRGESQAPAQPAPAADREEGRAPQGASNGQRQEGLQAGQGRQEVAAGEQGAAAVPSGSSAAAAPANETEPAPARTPSSGATPAGIVVTKTKHGKTGADLWLAKLPAKVSREEYDAFAARARAAGGKWSRFSKGFEFSTEAVAQEFAGGKEQVSEVSDPAPVVAPAPVPTGKAEIRPYRRPDGLIGYEAVPIKESPPAVPPPAPEPAPAPRSRPAPTANKIFTEDAAAKARERLRRKLGQLNTGLDPEVMQAGITLAGYHIEAGARKFAAYAEAMLADLGDAVRPYLKSWYLAVKFDPRAAEFAGEMTPTSEVEAASVYGQEDAAPAEQAAPAPAPRPAPPPTADPFAGDYDALVGKTITRTFKLDDGTTATMQVDAAEALRDIDRRAKAVKDLRACLRGAG